MKARDMKLEMVQLSGAEPESSYDQNLALRCHFVLLACDGLREWLYDEDGNPEGFMGSDLLNWLEADDGNNGDHTSYRIDDARADFPTEVQDCNRLLVSILDAG